MAHPRFRAAYDFLLLRAGESDAVRESGEWWTSTQALSPEQLSESLAGKTPAKAAEKTGDQPARSSRRRHRGGRRRKAAAPQTDPQA